MCSTLVPNLVTCGGGGFCTSFYNLTSELYSSPPVTVILPGILQTLAGHSLAVCIGPTGSSVNCAMPVKVCLVKAVVFPVVGYGCENWTIKLSAEELMLLNCGIREDS